MSTGTLPLPPRIDVAPRRLGAAMWTTGIATFGVLYAPQGLLTGIARTYDLTAADASWVVSAATLGLAASILPWALLADRLGRRRTMRIAAICAAVVAVTAPLLPGFAGLLVGRLLLGIALGGIPALAIAYVHEAAPAHRASVAAGAYVAATSVGGLAGRLAAAPIGDLFGWRLSLELLGAAAAALTVVFALLLPATEPHRPVRLRHSASTLARQIVNPRALPFYAIGALAVGALVATFNALGFRLEAPPFLLSATAVSLVFLTYLAGTVTSRSSGWAVHRWGERIPLWVGGGAIVVGALISLAPNLAVIVLGVLLLTAGMFLCHATANSAVARAGGSGRQHAVALYSVAYYCGSSVFGTLGALAWTAGGWGLLVAFIAALGLAIAAATLLVPRR
ncbi:MFS transporter [Microbacterium sp. W1N]|uniref:MFS transporter n=1 Tax=Microbacterium festucae TaxID=2977531 RepID=UPI0021C0F3EF|nr:MFS transporter [Microbacterium festucae]MCT9819839.1 MFS transporter [Microbacterium festucae]